MATVNIHRMTSELDLEIHKVSVGIAQVVSQAKDQWYHHRQTIIITLQCISLICTRQAIPHRTMCRYCQTLTLRSEVAWIWTIETLPDYPTSMNLPLKSAQLRMLLDQEPMLELRQANLTKTELDHRTLQCNSQILWCQTQVHHPSHNQKVMQQHNLKRQKDCDSHSTWAHSHPPSITIIIQISIILSHIWFINKILQEVVNLPRMAPVQDCLAIAVYLVHPITILATNRLSTYNSHSTSTPSPISSNPSSNKYQPKSTPISPCKHNSRFKRHRS